MTHTPHAHPDDARKYAPRPVYLAAGHTTRDLTPGGWRFGGSVAYAALAARRLDVGFRLITGYESDMGHVAVYDEFDKIVQPSAATTTFRNIESDGDRTQRISAVGDMLRTAGIPATWRRPDILHAAPIFGEIDDTFLRWFEPRLLGATVQGWLRAADDRGAVTARLHDAWDALARRVDVAIFSVSDLNQNIKYDDIVRYVSLCIETKGNAGCRILEGGRSFDVPTAELQVDDVTGAGDIFATAFLKHYFETGNPVDAARFANGFAGEMLASASFRADLSPTRSP